MLQYILLVEAELLFLYLSEGELLSLRMSLHDEFRMTDACCAEILHIDEYGRHIQTLMKHASLFQNNLLSGV